MGGEWRKRGHARLLPEPLDIILIEGPIIAHDRHVFGHGLRNQHSIERVLVGAGQRSRSYAVVCAYGQNFHSLPGHVRDKTLDQVRSCWQPSQADLGGDLPSRNGADQRDIVSLCDQGVGWLREAPIIRHPPNQGVGIQQKAHTRLLPAFQFFGRQRLEKLGSNADLPFPRARLPVAVVGLDSY
jgi:hypothetical protein